MKPISIRPRSMVVLFFCMLALSVGKVIASPRQYVVVESRGVSLKAGQKIPGDARVELKEGERVRLIAEDGRSIELRGPRSGPIAAALQGEAIDRRQALSALINQRNARFGSAGVVRAATAQSAVPDPWLIDISRPGLRCILEGSNPVLWRPEPLEAMTTVLYPADRSWRADIAWASGQDQLRMPEITPLDRPSTLIVQTAQQEHGLSLIVIPRSIDDDLILAAWMLDRGCIGQADALITRLSGVAPDPGRN